MDEEVDAEVVAVEDESHRVDEEGHVFGDEEQDRVRRVPAVAFEFGRQHLDEDLAGLTSATELEMGGARRVQIVASTVVGVVVGKLGVVLRQQRPEQRVVGSPLVRQRLEIAQNVGHVVVSHPVL